MVFTAQSMPDYAPLLDLLAQHQHQAQGTANDILTVAQKGQLQMPLNHLMSSFIHMSMNRLFRAKNRVHELVCYDYLYRYYKSAIARSQGKGKGKGKEKSKTQPA